MKNLSAETIWLTKPVYDEAEMKYYENLAKASLTPLAEEVAKARKRLIESRDTFKESVTACMPSVDAGAVKFLEKKVVGFEKSFSDIVNRINMLEIKVTMLEKGLKRVEQLDGNLQGKPVNIPKEAPIKNESINNDDDLDLFGSDSEEEEEVNKIKEERLAAYNAKKAKKPVLIAKSSIILDVKPWDDQTNMTQMEEEVRKIQTDGLLWGASKLVPLAYGIHKLQITCVVEDDKVSIDWLQEQIEEIESYVQSVDIAAFNKI